MSLTDMLRYFVILEDFIKPPSPFKSITYKLNFKNFDGNKLSEDFCKFGWDKVINEKDNNIYKAFNGFCRTLNELVNAYNTRGGKLLFIRHINKTHFCSKSLKHNGPLTWNNFFQSMKNIFFF